MKFPKWKLTVSSLVVAALAVLVVLANSLQHKFSDPKPDPAETPDADFAAFSALAPIDTHVHLYQDDPAFGALMQRLNLRALNICVIDDRDPFFKGLEPQRGDALKVRHMHRGPCRFVHDFQPLRFRSSRDSPSARSASSMPTSRREPSR